MRRLILFTGIFLLLSFLSCDKKEINDLDSLPEWLNQKIEQQALDQNLCEFNQIMTKDYNSSKFYVIQPAISSCMYCEVFDEYGTKPTWDENTWTDFRKNLKIIKTQTACK
jgi:hypothetical protein